MVLNLPTGRGRREEREVGLDLICMFSTFGRFKSPVSRIQITKEPEAELELEAVLELRGLPICQRRGGPLLLLTLIPRS